MQVQPAQSRVDFLSDDSYLVDFVNVQKRAYGGYADEPNPGGAAPYVYLYLQNKVDYTTHQTRIKELEEGVLALRYMENNFVDSWFSAFKA